MYNAINFSITLNDSADCKRLRAVDGPDDHQSDLAVPLGRQHPRRWRRIPASPWSWGNYPNGNEPAESFHRIAAETRTPISNYAGSFGDNYCISG